MKFQVNFQTSHTVAALIQTRRPVQATALEVTLTLGYLVWDSLFPCLLDHTYLQAVCLMQDVDLSFGNTLPILYNQTFSMYTSWWADHTETPTMDIPIP